MVLLWRRQRRTENANAVDAGWAGLIGFAAGVYALAGDGLGLRRLAIAALVGFWSIRLTSYLVRARVLGEASEDGRYAALRRSWSQRTFFVFFQAQALLAVVLSVPFLVIAMNPAPTMAVLEWCGIVVCLGAFVGETIADKQLDAFRARPENRGTTCRAGLWRYSRHPNYFFEWLTWCGWALFALPAPYGAAGLISPLLMYLSIVKVTGIPPTEAQALRSRGEDYRRYQETTNAFFPWFPKAESERENGGA